MSTTTKQKSTGHSTQLHHNQRQQKKIAIIGSGISGLSAGWLLSKYHHVSIYEKNDKLGGHTNSITVKNGQRDITIDTGFIVFNNHTYPNLWRLFDHIGLEVTDSDMSFAVSVDNGGFEYSGTGFGGIFAQKRNVIRPRMWSMLSDLRRFYKMAPLDRDYGGTLGDYLRENSYNDPFILDHLVPMTAAIWSSPGTNIDLFPFQTFVDFCINHGLLNYVNRPQWRTVPGGAAQYIPLLTENFNEINTNRQITSIRRDASGVFITDQSGQCCRYDDIVIATHGDEALAMLDTPSDDEKRLLSCFRYSKNRALLHTDPSFMPKRKSAWASWNVIENNGPIRGGNLTQQMFDDSPLCVTYWMNKLQPLDTDTQYFVTLNPRKKCAPESVLYETSYYHPIFDDESTQAQKQLWQLQGKDRTWYCGAHFGYGFHEDGLQSGLKIAEILGGTLRPWHSHDMNDRILPLRANMDDTANTASHGVPS